MNDTSEITGPDEPCIEKRLAVAFAALSHPVRLAILRRLSAQCCCCGDVVGGLDLAQSTVSQHLKVLVAAGLVEMQADRQRSLYRIDRKALGSLVEAVATFAHMCGADPAGRCCDPADNG